MPIGKESSFEKQPKTTNKKEDAEKERKDSLATEQHAKEMEEYNRQVRDLERYVEAIREDRDNADYDNYDTIQLKLESRLEELERTKINAINHAISLNELEYLKSDYISTDDFSYDPDDYDYVMKYYGKSEYLIQAFAERFKILSREELERAEIFEELEDLFQEASQYGDTATRDILAKWRLLFLKYIEESTTLGEAEEVYLQAKDFPDRNMRSVALKKWNMLSRNETDHATNAEKAEEVFKYTTPGTDAQQYAFEKWISLTNSRQDLSKILGIPLNTYQRSIVNKKIQELS